MWEKVVKKAVDVEAKASLQPSFETREIDSRCPKRYKPLVYKDKDDAYWEQRDGAFYKDKKRPNPITLLLLLISLRLKLLALRNAKKRSRRRLSSH